MVEIIIKTKVKASNVENAKKAGVIFNSISRNVSEQEISDLANKLKEKPTLFKGLISKLNNPLIKNLI